MRRSRKQTDLPALLALLLMGAWVLIGIVHEHTGAPVCQICNALQLAAADVIAPATLDQPAEAGRPLAPAPLPAAATPSPSTPPGRAPPLA